MTEKIVLDTTITEPSLSAGEVETLFFALDRARAQFAWKVGGLDTDQLRLLHPPSTSTIGGLIKHLAQVEDTYISRFLTGEPLGEPWNAAGDEPIWEWAYRTAADDTAEELYTLWKGAVERSRKTWENVLAAGDLDQPSAFSTPSGQRPNMRRALVDTIEEYIRHTGQADILREAIDGLVGNDPPQ